MAFATLDRGASTREGQALWGRRGSQPLCAQTTTQQGQPSPKAVIADEACFSAADTHDDNGDDTHAIAAISH